jgi:hypothetical protein
LHLAANVFRLRPHGDAQLRGVEAAVPAGALEDLDGHEQHRQVGRYRRAAKVIDNVHDVLDELGEGAEAAVQRVEEQEMGVVVDAADDHDADLAIGVGRHRPDQAVDGAGDVNNLHLGSPIGGKLCGNPRAWEWGER